jgi:hypothetical protein
MKNIEIISMGICSASICADEKLSVKEITNLLNESYPTGISSKWALSKDKTFRTGEKMPCSCEKNKDRKHYLFNC